MVRGPVTFDTGKISTRAIGIHDPEVDAKTGHPDLGASFPPLGAEGGGDGFFERALGRPKRSFFTRRQGNRAALSIIQKGFQIPNPGRACPRQIDLVMGQRRIDMQFAPRACDGNQSGVELGDIGAVRAARV